MKKEQGKMIMKMVGKIFWGVRGLENTVFSVFQSVFFSKSGCFFSNFNMFLSSNSGIKNTSYIVSTYHSINYRTDNQNYIRCNKFTNTNFKLVAFAIN